MRTRRDFIKTIGAVGGGLALPIPLFGSPPGAPVEKTATTASSAAENFANAFYEALVKGVTGISPDVQQLLEQGLQAEDSPIGRTMLEAMLANLALARKQNSGVCQSPGIPYVYLRFGPNMADIDYRSIISSAVSRVTNEGYLRPSIVHSLTRKNSGNNSGPGIPTFEFEQDPALDHLQLIVSFKGCGAESANAFRTFTPETMGPNLDGIKRFVLETVIDGGGIPCPPIGLGIGIGGQMHTAAWLSRKAISTRRWDDHNPDPQLDRLEQDFKEAINQLGIGPAGTGGKVTALAVKIGMAYTHTAICPVAVNFHCWTARRFGFNWYRDGKKEVFL